MKVKTLRHLLEQMDWEYDIEFRSESYIVNFDCVWDVTMEEWEHKFTWHYYELDWKYILFSKMR